MIRRIPARFTRDVTPHTDLSRGTTVRLQWSVRDGRLISHWRPGPVYATTAAVESRGSAA
jgi:hypothetical protein